MGAADDPTKQAASPPVKRDRSAPPPLPRWVKGFGWAAIVAIVLFVAAHLSGVMPMGGH